MIINKVNKPEDKDNFSEIPKGWEVVELGEIGEFKNGINKEKEEFGHGFPLVSLMDVFGIPKVYNGDFSLVNTTENERHDFDLKKGDILFVRSSVKPEGVGLTSLVCQDMPNTTFSGFLIRFRDKGILDFEYKAHCFFENSFRQRLLTKSTISANTNINQVALKSLRICFPPLPEQKAIAHALGLMDIAINTNNQLIAQKELRKKWLMQNLLTGKKRVKGFEGEWRKLKAGEIFKSNTVKRFENEELLSATQDRGIIPRSMLEGRVTMPEGTISGYKLVEPGDFVISLRSFQGGLEYSYYRGLVSPAYTVLKPKRKIEEEFYKQYYKSQEFISRLAIAVIGIRDGKQISFDDFCTVKIPYPSPEEQTAIAQVLQAADKQIQLLKTKSEKLREQKKGMMQVLLTGRKRLNNKYYEEKAI
ncbi:MAG: restriction endonuclease subunit S [Bacteroidales bacterium]